MRAGAYTIHQSLTAEAAAVLKLALGLARRRGHAQVTPLHVAFALLTTGPAAAPPPHLGAFSSSSSSSSPAAAYGLLKRACLRSHPAAAHPLQCRALELCFNVALNRLPAASAPHSPPPGSASFASSLIQPSPTLSNALVAALKRAQANQRRGCVELHQPPPTAAPSAAQQQQTQPLLSIRVELDQLVISILDDPSVSRVMREAGFSSATVKTNLEEESALMPPPSSSSSSPPPHPPPPHAQHFFLDPSSIATGGSGFGMWPAAQFLSSAPAPGPPAGMSPACKDDDVRAVLEVMARKQGRRSNPVVVGDSVSMAEAVAGELLRRLERGEGDVPEELAGAHLLKLQLSYVHVRLMSRADVDARAAELRRSVDAARLQRGGLVVYVGDLRWALDEEPAHGAAGSSAYSPVEHMVAELGRLLGDLRASRGRAWLLATASYQTYMRWQQRRRRSLEDAWALQAVLVPTGGGTGLALNNLHPSPSRTAAPGQPAMVSLQQPGQSHFTMPERDVHEEKLVLCTECSKNYEREASLVKAEADAEGRRSSLPAWLVLDRPPADQAHHKDKYLLELKRKWSRLCRKLHLCSDPPCPWWSGPCMPPSRPSIAGFLGLEGLMAHGNRRTNDWSPPATPQPRRGLASSPREPGYQDAGAALALGNLPLSDTATFDARAPGRSDGGAAVARELLEQRLRRNVPWQPGAAAAEIAEAVAGRGTGVWLYVKGSDRAAVRRAAAVIAEARCGSADRVVCGDLGTFAGAEEFCAGIVSRASDVGGGKLVLVFGDVERAPEDVVDCLVAASKSGSLKHHSGQELDLSESVVILTQSKCSGAGDDVISLRLWSEDDASSGDHKRKPDTEQTPAERKRPRHDAGRGLDLNIDLCADDSDDDDAIPSDITHEGSSDEDEAEHRPQSLLESVAGRVVTLDDGGGRPSGHLRARLVAALGQPGARVDDEAVEALAAAAGHFLDETLERWAGEVLGPAAAATVRNGGKADAVVVLGVGRGGGGARQAGFMGSVLPSRVHVD